MNGLNSLPNDIFLDWSKLKALADNKINVNEKMKFGLERVENIVGKEKNAGYQHFLLFPKCFQKGFLLSYKSELCGKELIHFYFIAKVVPFITGYAPKQLRQGYTDLSGIFPK